MSSYYPADELKDPLIGKVLSGGWIIRERVQRHAKQTGSNFSIGYIVQRGTETAYMKAFDFEEALSDPEPIKALEQMSSSFNFEVDLLKVCADAKMSRIVRALAHGVEDCDGVPFRKLCYLIFELADGDIRKQIYERVDPARNQMTPETLTWRIRCLHQIAAALEQLHNKGIYHQDLKPSNVLVFSQMNVSKLADLGRAHFDNLTAPHYGSKLPELFATLRRSFCTERQ